MTVPCAHSVVLFTATGVLLILAFKSCLVSTFLCGVWVTGVMGLDEMLPHKTCDIDYIIEYVLLQCIYVFISNVSAYNHTRKINLRIQR